MMPERVGFLSAFRLFFKRYVDFTGRSSRSEYWWWQLWAFLIGLVYFAALIMSVVLPMTNGGKGDKVNWPLIALFLILAVVYGFGTLIPRIALMVRRFRDAGVNPLWLLVTWGAPYLYGQWNSFGQLSQLNSNFGSSSDLVRVVTSSGTFSIGVGVAFVFELINLVITLKPSRQED